MKTHILIVDDKPENLLALEALLSSDEIKLIKALSGEEALAKTFDFEFALLLMDVHMPKMDGFETAELLRGNSATKDIPIIFVSANYKEQTHIFKGYESGAVDYLFKPIEEAVLKSKVEVFIKLFRQRLLIEKKNKELHLKKMELDQKLVDLEELQQALEEKNNQLKILSTTDGLTGLYNRRHFNEILEKEWARALRSKKELSLIILDIDEFKLYNDSYGHIGGDDCLKRIAKALCHHAKRSSDFVSRYGGEEFAILLPRTTLQGAMDVAEKMRENIFNLKIKHSKKAKFEYVTISLGVSTALPEMGITSESLVASADKALYYSKAEGRNKTSFLNSKKEILCFTTF